MFQCSCIQVSDRDIKTFQETELLSLIDGANLWFELHKSMKQIYTSYSYLKYVRNVQIQTN